MFYSGTQGQLFIDGSKAAKVRNWSFNASLSVLDTTTLGDTDATITPGIRTNTGSCQLFYYDIVGSPNSASTLINKVLKKGTDGVANEADLVEFKLATDDGQKYITGSGYITSAGMSCAVGEVLSADISFQINGAWKEVKL